MFADRLFRLLELKIFQKSNSQNILNWEQSERSVFPERMNTEQFILSKQFDQNLFGGPCFSRTVFTRFGPWFKAWISSLSFQYEDTCLC